MPRWRSILLVGVGLLVLVACATARQPGGTGVRQQPTPAAPATQIVPTPAPGPVPPNCPVTDAHPRPVFSQLAPVIGVAPVWATQFPGPVIYHIGPPLPYFASYGWPVTKTIWEVGPNYSSAVMVRGHDITDHTPLFFQFGDATPTADAQLDPHHPGHFPSVIGAGWAEWGSYIVVPKAGCYMMDVSWPTGHWDITFAVGRVQ